ncbi:MAG TPA: SDR family NAD(P)-dependent oxidoreductase [Thermoanaerobaculaceae bacterium]|nr:SDR family NAD(P)-dependent oxidoreductase [Thermoanaerobaculaceae bacterium]
MREKVIVITGGSGGIGATLAVLAASRGARLILAARREKELREVAARCGPGALAVPADVTRREDVERVLAAALARFGRVDIWVNNAGRGITKLVSELTDEDLDDMIRVNVKSALYGMQAVLPHFIGRGQGHIVNVSSMLARVPYAVQRSAYSAAKHALCALTANLRMELAERYPHIHVTSVHPGVVATDFGLNALHGGTDSHAIPGAQTAEQVAEVIAGVIERPRADVYTRPDGQRMVCDYFAAEDMGEAERRPPFVHRLPSK